MQSKTVKLESSIKLTYDENSEPFQNALDDFRAVVKDGADADDMLKQIALVLAQSRDHLRMIEGVGYVRYNGFCKNENLYCGVDVDTDDPDWYATFDE